VAVSRAKRHLFLFGHLASLQKNLTWGKVIKHFAGPYIITSEELIAKTEAMEEGGPPL